MHFTLDLCKLSLGLTNDGEKFDFVGSARFEEDHKRFVEVRDLGDPNLLANFANLHPHHIESLLAMYDLLMSTGQSLHAEECLKRFDQVFLVILKFHF